MGWLHNLADLAAIITAGVAVFAFVPYYLTLQGRKSKLEKLLATKNRPNDDSLTIPQCATELKMTEDQVIEAASKSRKVEGWGGQSGLERRLRTKR